MNAPNQGFDELFNRLFPVIARTVVRIVDDRAEAEDVAAEAFARALARWRTIGRLDWREAWITRVAVNLAIDRADAIRRPWVTPMSAAIRRMRSPTMKSWWGPWAACRSGSGRSSGSGISLDSRPPRSPSGWAWPKALSAST
jgi:DNA-directed RNA polymerase specialized sigma24 family protein